MDTIYTRYFVQWLAEFDCSLVISSYKSNKVFTLSSYENKLCIYFTNAPRAMGLSYTNDKLVVSSLGNLTTYVNQKKIMDTKYGMFDTNFIPEITIHKGDVDIHDIHVNKSGKIFYISSLFSCVCTPNEKGKTFNVFWKPPWISKISSEDRCHLNGLCFIDDKLRFVTSVCKSDIAMGWLEKSNVNKGVVYDVEKDEVYCEGLSQPHSPRWHDNKLWLLDAGRGYFGCVEDNKFKRKVFIPGFLRGLTFHNGFAIVTSSFDRHDNNFKDIELGKILEEKKAAVKCGVWIINMERFDIVHNLQFKGEVKELYDVVVVPNSGRGRVFDLADTRLLNNFNL